MTDYSSEAFYTPFSLLWDYLRRPSALHKADCIVGFGNYNRDIGIRAAELYFEGYAPKILFSGGLGRNTLGLQNTTEAETFASVAIENGVPDCDILLESKSRNTAENILYTREILDKNGIRPSCIIAVHQPFMERRIAAAFDVYWPGIELLTTSYECDIPTFLDHAAVLGINAKTVVEELVGDFQRMELYAELGYQSRQSFPAEAWDAYHELISMGYTGQLAK